MNEESGEGRRFLERLVSLKRQGETDTAFSERIGVKTSTWKQYAKGSSPSLDILIKVSGRTGVDLSWLAKGEQSSGPLVPAPTSSDMVLVPVIDAQPSAGQGSVVEAEPVAGVMAFRRDLIRNLGVSSAAALRVLEARGNSMEPAIRAGDLILVDTAIDRVEDEGVYVFRFAGALVVKRIRFSRVAGGVRVELVSDNGGASEAIPEADLPDLHAAGRVVRVIRAL